MSYETPVPEDESTGPNDERPADSQQGNGQVQADQSSLEADPLEETGDGNSITGEDGDA
jgi:hypothetical protein